MYKNTRRATKPPKIPLEAICLVPMLVVPSFEATAVAVAPTLEQPSVAHVYPEGQQFPPTEAAQLNHPVAHDPAVLVAVEAAVPTGTTIVSPAVTIVVELVAGQEVVWQSLPVRQQPPA